MTTATNDVFIGLLLGGMGGEGVGILTGGGGDSPHPPQ